MLGIWRGRLLPALLLLCLPARLYVWRPPAILPSSLALKRQAGAAACSPRILHLMVLPLVCCRRSRLVSSMPYLKGDAPSQLDVYVPKITRAYITSRLESGEAARQYSGRLPFITLAGAGDVLECQRAGWSVWAQPRAVHHDGARRGLSAPYPAVQAVVMQGGEDPLDNEEQLQVGRRLCVDLPWGC